MNKTNFYLSQCAEAASKSQMCYTLGAVMVKGGKVISSGHNHHRPHYDGAELRTHGHRKPVSMHAEMHAIFNLTGMSPSFKKQTQQNEQKGQKGAPALSAAPQSPGSPPPSASRRNPRYTKNKNKRGRTGRPAQSPAPSSSSSSSPDRAQSRSVSPCRESGSGSRTGSGSGKGGGGGKQDKGAGAAAGQGQGQGPGEKGWAVRRRSPRANGADLYVARFTKNGVGGAAPCWRCLAWCRWAGVKRVFHWNGELGRFEVIKVNSAQGAMYETHADFRLFAGLGW
ncbi:hypothetical protein CERSUDRAFT_127616 [Gelatoporia subvermispora B]|uniref:CMP/dCMP-type deaminase domain-containing protein n=1 Tax=Ceriporiopsis subvermispora (strain B) TaxID=914234 RepID=M2Q2P1_CERS8|nr:hypothetical protein CERSUDRAFT_127616 [Gelatoporia subvermispora B]